MAETLWASLSNELAAAASAAGQSVVAVVGRRHPSSGVVFRDDAVVTVHHGLRRDEDITIILGPEERTSGRVVGRDPGTDLAVLRLEKPIGAPPARWAPSADLRVGEYVMALGRSWRGNVVASAGILSGVINERFRTWRGGELDRFVRPDLTLYPGFSGGPLLANSGDFLGVNTAGLHRSGIAVPASTVVRVATELLEKGRIETAWLGLGMQSVPLPESLRTRLNLIASEGLLVAHVEPGGPAEKAGVMLGDTLIELNGKAVADTESVQDVLRTSKPGEQIEAAVIRAGAQTRVKIRLEARPAR